ncbi:MFS transporter [Streptomyces niveus]|uniref:MFS transporter n=1 Tax=Streptomyces niveus TaxID=193462 RepID=UPI003867BD41
MPLAVYILGLSVFALGTSEFMLSGLLPPIADDMDVSIPQAGLLISAFAIGMVVGAPLLAAGTLRMPRRTTLIALISVFGLGQVAGALAPTYEVLFVSRVVSAFACAGFWAVGAASAIALVGVATLIPRIPLPERKPELRRELLIYRDRQVWLAIAITALAAGGVFCAFSYLAPLLTDVAGLDEGWVPTVLALFGVGALIGTVIGGRVADAHLFGVLLSGVVASTVFLAALALLASSAVAVVVLSLLLGFSAFFTAPALNARMFNVAAAAPILAGATATSAFNLGNTGGPWLGGTVIDAGLGFASTAWAGAAMTVVAAGLVTLAMRHQRAGRTRVIAKGPESQEIQGAQTATAESSRL